MEESAVGILPPALLDVLIFLSIVLSIILLIALSYVWSIQRQDRADIAKLSSSIKNLSKKIMELESANNKQDLKPDKEDVVKVISNDNSINSTIKTKSVVPEPVKKIENPWASFLEDYNHIAASMAVPGQLKACEKFVAENKLKILIYTGSMNFIFASNVAESKFWAWQIEEDNKFVVVPNPMIKYDEELHNIAGMKETFASNYENGKYTKYFVELPAILNCNENNKWNIVEPGVIKLER